MLSINDIHTYYGESHILQGLTLEVRQGEAVALLGRNGVGKTTTISSIIGFEPPLQVYFSLVDVAHLALQHNPVGDVGLAR